MLEQDAEKVVKNHDSETASGKSRGWSVQSLVALLCALLLAPGDTMRVARQAQQPGSPMEQDAPKIPNDQRNSLVAPIATYPLEIIQSQQWIQKNSTLKGADLTNAVENQDWDPNIQAMAVFPDLVKRMGDDIKWIPNQRSQVQRACFTSANPL